MEICSRELSPAGLGLLLEGAVSSMMPRCDEMRGGHFPDALAWWIPGELDVTGRFSRWGLKSPDDG